MEAYTRIARLPAPKRAPLELASLIGRVADIETRLKAKLEPGPAVKLLADSDQLEQALINLVRNATDAALLKDPAGTNAKLKVSFFGPFYGDYWVLDHADDYSWSIVGEASGRYLWILSREPKPSDQVVGGLIKTASAMGYDTSMLIFDRHRRY